MRSLSARATSSGSTGAPSRARPRGACTRAIACARASGCARSSNASHQRSERDVGIGVEAERHAAVQRLDGAPLVHAPRRHAEVRVAHDHAQQQQRVGLLDERRDLRRAGEPEIGAHERRVGVLEQPASHEGRDDGNAEAARERRHLRLEAEAAHLHVHHEHGRARGRQPRQDFFRRTPPAPRGPPAAAAPRSAGAQAASTMSRGSSR